MSIDELIKTQAQAKSATETARKELAECGVKRFVNGVLSLNDLPNNHGQILDVDAYTKCKNQEFVWEAEYKDGTILKQFDGKKEKNLGNINQDKLKLIRWVSNFSWGTDNEEKRVIVTLDWITGLWSFHNGLVSQEVRAAVMNGFPKEIKPKLVLIMRKQPSFSAGVVGNEVTPTGESWQYNRYILGWGTEEVDVVNDKGEKMKKVILEAAICIEPNGGVHLQ
jgi:hypothetical protein